MELNKRLFNKDANLFAKKMMQQLSLEPLCTPDELHAGCVDMIRIGRFQITTSINKCKIEYLTQEDFKNKKFNSYKAVRKDLLIFSAAGMEYIYGTDAKGKKFIKDIYYYCDSYPYFAVLLAYYEILTEKGDLTKKENSIKKRINTLINLGKEDCVSYKNLQKLFYETIQTIDYDALKQKIKMGKEAVEFYKVERQKENEEREKDIAEQQAIQERKKKRRPLIIATAPVSLPAIGLKKLSNKFMMFLSSETKKDKRKRQEKERQEAETIQAQDIEEFKNF